MSDFIDETLLLALGDFECDEEGDNNLPIGTQNYVNEIFHQSTLKILQDVRVTKAYKDAKELGLFHLFISRSWFQAMRNWVNINLAAEGKPTINEMHFEAYVGLEMATSLVSVNSLKGYWSQEMFCGQADFKDTMPRDTFLLIRRMIVLCPPGSYDHELSSNDPIWHSRKMLEHVQKNIAKVAVPLGSSALDEAGFRTKARTKARSYIPNKPDKYAIRMYAVVGTANAYCSSIMNNGSGNTTAISPGEDYCHVH